MNREEVISAVKNDTGVNIDEVTTLCQNHIDRIQDKIASGLYYEANIPKGHDFSFLIGYNQINTSASYTTGTVAVTNNSTTVTGTDTSWTSSHVGWIFKVGTEYYEVSAVVSATELTLKNAYIGDTASGSSYSLIKMHYSLPSDFKSVRWIKQLVTHDRIIPLSEFTMAEYLTDEFSYSGELSGYIISGNKKIRFFPTPTAVKRVYICYDKELASINSTGAESIIPSKWHMLFVFALSEVVWRRLDRPEKIVEAKAEYNEMMYQFVTEDKKITRDKIEFMQDEKIILRKISHPRFPSNYPVEFT